MWEYVKLNVVKKKIVTRQKQYYILKKIHINVKICSNREVMNRWIQHMFLYN